MSRPAIVELQDVSLDYPDPGGTVTALDHVNVSFHAGTSSAVMGRSGSGKSTLLSVLGLMRSPTSGSVKVMGEAISHDAETRSRVRATTVGMVFQSFHLDPVLTAVENTALAWHLGMVRVSAREARQRAGELLDLVGLGGIAHRKVASMSGGERQRVAIARALFGRPPLFLADEPTGNLDEDSAEAVAAIIWSLPRVLGTAVVVVTHDAIVGAGAQRMLRMDRGRIEEESP